MNGRSGSLGAVSARLRMAYLRRRLAGMGRGSAFQRPGPEILGGERIQLGEGVFGRPFVRLQAITSRESPASGPILLIGNGSYLGFHVSIFATRGVTIGRDVYLNGHVTIYDHYPPLDARNEAEGAQRRAHQESGLGVAEVSIGDRAWLGWGSVVLPGVRIGVHAVLGANSVATEDIPDHCVAVGNPATVVRRYDHGEEAWRPADKGEGS